MSQLPAPVLGSGGDPYAARSNQAIALGGRQNIQSLESPGRAAMPGVAANEGLYRQLADTFGIAHAGANAMAGHFAHLNSLDRGLAAQRAKEILPDWLAKMERGDLETPLDLDLVPGTAEQLVADMMPEGVTRAFADEFRARLTPQFIQAMHNRALSKHQENFEALKTVSIEGLAHETDPAKIQEAVDELIQASYLPVDPEQTARDFGLHAARVAALTGNAEAFKAAESFLAGREPMALAQYANQLEVAQRQAQSREEKEIRDALMSEVAAIYNEADREGTPIPVERALSIIEQADPMLQRSMRDELERRTASHNRALAQQRAEIRFGLQQEEIFDAVANIMEMPDKPYPTELLLQKLSVTFGGDEDSFQLTDPETGLTKTIPFTEVMQAVKQSHFNMLDQTLPPEQAFAEKMTFLSRNNMTDKQWTAMLTGGANAALSEWARIIDKGEAEGIPQTVTNAYQIYRQMGTQNRQLRDAHISSQSQRDFFDIAETMEVYGFQSPQQALMTAVKAMSPKGHFHSSYDRIESRKEIERAARQIATTGHVLLWNKQVAENRGEVMTALSTMANVYANSGLAPELAMERAKQRVNDEYLIVNNWAVPFKGQLPPDANEIFQDLFKQYVEKYGEQEALTVNDLSLVAGTEPNTLILFSKKDLAPVENALTDGFLTVRAIQEVSLDRRMQREAEQRAERMAASQAELERQAHIRSGNVSPVDQAKSYASTAGRFAVDSLQTMGSTYVDMFGEGAGVVGDKFSGQRKRDQQRLANIEQSFKDVVMDSPAGSLYRWLTTPRYVASFDESKRKGGAR